jgi:adenine-specific DNA-methyltransferase
VPEDIQSVMLEIQSRPPREAGVVFTKPWMVEIILDLAGYTEDRRLAGMVALEPSAGDGAFLKGMVRRLISSARRHRMPIAEAVEAIQAFDIDKDSVEAARETVRAALIDLEVPAPTAFRLAERWVKCADFLELSLGFPIADFVIGNPPYIRLEDIPDAKEKSYRNAYSAMRGRSDLFVAFYQAALQQLLPGGVCAYICADRWLLNDYGRGLRQFITTGDYNVQCIVEVHDVDAFEHEVSAYPAITVISKGKQGPVVVAKALPGIETAAKNHILQLLAEARSNEVLHAARFTQWFKGEDPWPCSSPERLALLKRLEAEFPPLESEGTRTTIGIGVATGNDEVFIIAGKPDIETSRLLPLAMAQDLAGNCIDWSGHHLVNPWDKDGLISLADYPKMAGFLTPHRTALSQRHTAKAQPDKWHKTIDRVNFDLLRKHKLYIADIRSNLRPALDEGRTYPHHNLYWVTSERWDLRVLGAILMSEVGEFFVRCYSVRMRGGALRFQAQNLRRIRVPVLDTLSEKIKKQLAAAFDDYDVAGANILTKKIYGIDRIP